jgi:peroxiredoxin
MLVTLFAIVVFFQALLVVLAVLAFYHVIKQQGRLLNRVDIIEERLDFVFRSVARLEKQIDEIGSQPPLPAIAAQPEMPFPPPEATAGLAVGEPIAAFGLSDLNGSFRQWEGFRGKRLLLMHWNPGCGFCDLIATELAGMQAALKERNVHLLFLSYGEADTNRQMLAEHALEPTVLLIPEGQPVIEAFKFQGTPVAYLVDEEGKVAHALMAGADKVLALARQVLQEGGAREPTPMSTHAEEAASNGHQAEAAGLKAGTRAPGFTLSDVEGKPMSLENYRGKPVLLVFSDPQCHSCDELSPQLERVHQGRFEHGVEVLMVGRGDLETNRSKIQEHHLSFPVGLQSRKWSVAKQYGTLATPVAYWINAEGVIVRDVAVGLEGILALASEATKRVLVGTG